MEFSSAAVPEDEMHEFELKVTEDDFVGSRYLHQRVRPAFKALGCVVAVFLFLVGLLGTRTALAQNEGYLPVAVLWCLGLFLVWWYFFAIRSTARKLFRQRADTADTTSCSLSDQGLSMSSSRGNVIVFYSDLHKWREGSDLLLLYPSDDLYFIVPKRLLDEPALTYLTERLRERLGPAT